MHYGLFSGRFSVTMFTEAVLPQEANDQFKASSVHGK
jgi:hypothetical protein